MRSIKITRQQGAFELSESFRGDCFGESPDELLQLTLTLAAGSEQLVLRRRQGYLPRPSFDCKLARSKVEKAVCASVMLADYDARLAQLYALGLATQPSPEAKRRFRRQQRQWLARRSAEELSGLLLTYSRRLGELWQALPTSS